MKIYYATTNPGKIQSLKRDLSKYKMDIVQAPLDMPESRSYDVQEIAKEKIVFAYKHLKKPVVALDAGFHIYSLNNFPKTFINFTLETIGIEGILDLVKNKSRKCEFIECLTYLDESLKEPESFVSHVKGTLSYEPLGKLQKHLWSKLGLIFIPDGSSKTLAEMDYKEYLEWRRITREKTSSARLFGDWLYASNRLSKEGIQSSKKSA